MQVVRRSLAVLRAVAEHSNGTTLQELSRGLDLPAATTHRLLAALTDERFLVRNPLNKRYSLGPDALALFPRVRHVADAVRDDLHELAASTGETAYVSELVGDRAICTSLVESARPLRLFVRVGQELPLHAAASARAILAFCGETRIQQIVDSLDFQAFTPETPTSPAELLSHLAEVRRRGYDVCDQELDPGVWAAGAPIREISGDVVASVTIAGPIDRLDRVRQRRITDEVVASAERVSARFGYTTNPYANGDVGL